VCGAPLDKDIVSQVRAEAQIWQQRQNATLPEAIQGQSTPKVGTARKCKKYVLHDLLQSAFDVMKETGGAVALVAIRKTCPRYDALL
jgi:hypothetical protein